MIVPTEGGINALRAAAIEVETGTRHTLLEGIGAPRYLPSREAPHLGHLITGYDSNLIAVPFKLDTLEVGTPVPVLQGVAGIGGLVFFGVSPAGTLAFSAAAAQSGAALVAPSQLTWVDRQGNEEPLTTPVQGYYEPRISRSGDRIAVGVSTGQRGDLWVHDVGRETLTRLTFGKPVNRFPVWSERDERIYYASASSLLASDVEILSSLSDGSGTAQPLFPPGEQRASVPQSISSNGELLANTTPPPSSTGGGDGSTQIWSVKVGADGTAVGETEDFLDARFAHQQARFSPDGRWVAFGSNQSGRPEVFVARFPDGSGLTQISTVGGSLPRWGSDGRELFFRNGDQLLAVDTETSEASVQAGTPHVLFSGPYREEYDVHPDGKRFLMMKPTQVETAGPATTVLHGIVNWREELTERVPLDEVR